MKPCLNNLINDLKTQGEWKIQLAMVINFVSSKDFDKTRTIRTNCGNIEIVIGYEKDKIIEEIFESLLQKHQDGLEERITGSEFIFDSVDLLYYKCHKISPNRSVSYIDFPKLLQNKNATINPKNNDNKCLQYAITAALNYEQSKSYPERISKLKPFINQYNWKKINFPLRKSDRKKIETNNKSEKVRRV